jgi:multiple sugar transport system ATP-binding protein
MIFVTHDQVEAMTLADRIVVLNGGGIEQVGTPMEIYLRPRTRFVATFVGSPKINLLAVTVEAAPSGNARARLGDGTVVDTAVPFAGLRQGEMTLGLRAETVRVTNGGDAATHGTVEVVERLGERTLVHTLLADGARLVAEDAGVSAVRSGDRIGLTIDRAAAHLFDAAGLGHHRAEPA